MSRTAGSLSEAGNTARTKSPARPRYASSATGAGQYGTSACVASALSSGVAVNAVTSGSLRVMKADRVMSCYRSTPSAISRAASRAFITSAAWGALSQSATSCNSRGASVPATCASSRLTE